jgi:GWxTD domain-containing protein
LESTLGNLTHAHLSGFATRSSGIAVLLTLGLLLPFAPSIAAQKAAQKQKLEKSYKEWLERDVVYIITSDERKTFLKLTTDDDRDQFIQNFWEVRNPNPGSPDNTFKDQVYERIAYANANFGAGSNEEGWRTDRGRAYITLGPPQQKEVHYNASNMFPLEVWFYSYNHPSLPPFFYLMFYKHEGFGDFRFYSPFVDGPDKLMTGTEYINDRQGSIQAIQNSVGPEVARLSQSLIPGEPIDPTEGRPSLTSDAMLATIKGLADNPFTKQELERRRALLGSVTARVLIPGQNLDVATLPLRDSHGLTRLDYVMRFRQPFDVSLTQRADGNYFYNLQARVRVFEAGKLGEPIFTQERNLKDAIDKQQYDDLKNRRVGYEGSLPLPPGKYRLEFALTDWKKGTALQASKDIQIPDIDPAGVTIPGMIPFSSVRQADPANADSLPFTLAGLTFVPLGTNPLSVPLDETIQVAYQVWAPPQEPSNYADQKMTVEYAIGRPAIEGGASVITEDITKDQFDPMGSLVSGKKLPLLGQPPGAYLLSISINQNGQRQRAFSTLPFSVLPSATIPDVWDLTDPAPQRDVESGITDRERALCLFAEGKADDARPWFRRALARNHSDEIARSRLVEAYSTRKDYAAIQSLYKDAGITDETDPGTILLIAEGLERTSGVPDAVSLLQSAIQSRKESGPLYLALAGYYRKNGDAKKAAETETKGKALLNTNLPQAPASK